MTSTVTLLGPGLIALIALAVLIWAMSAYVTIDSLRRRRTDYAGVGEGRWFYAVPQLLFFIAFFLWQIPFIQQRVPWIGSLLIAIPLILAQQIGYLLRVVFPTAKRLEKRLAAEDAAGYHDEVEEDEVADELDEELEEDDEGGFLDPDPDAEDEDEPADETEPADEDETETGDEGWASDDALGAAPPADDDEDDFFTDGD
jgi:hypothetical protein